MHHAEILIGHFREMARNWLVASCYFVLCMVWYHVPRARHTRQHKHIQYLGIIDAEGDEGQAAETELKGEPEDDTAEQPCQDTTAVLQNCLDLV